MFLPKNGMAMFTSETGQQALSLLQQLPGKVGCDVQRSRKKRFLTLIFHWLHYSLWEGAFVITHYIFKGVTDVTVVGDNYSDYEIKTVINNQRLIPAIDGEGGYQHVL